MDEREQDSTVVSFIGRAKETIVAAAEAEHADDAARQDAERPEK